jgi:polyisoprenoid-binding protein YceI
MKKLFNVAIVMILLVFTASAQSFNINASQSTLEWNAKKVTGEHHGKIALKSGQFELKNDRITSGKFFINMETITCEDLEGEWRDKLIGHLKSDDFFSVENHPETILELKSSTKLIDGKTTIKGDLTIKGITHPIEFEAIQKDHAFKAVITIDRTLYNIRYGSGKFFDNLGDKTINDKFTLDVELVAAKL